MENAPKWHKSDMMPQAVQPIPTNHLGDTR